MEDHQEHIQHQKPLILSEYGHAQPVVVQDAKKQLDNESESKMDWFKTQIKKTFSKKTLYKRVPITDWLPKYNLETGVADFIAGLTVGLTVIPQGIAYALVANLEPQVVLFVEISDFA